MEQTKILIIEDNFLTLSEIEIRVQSMGYSNTETAISGEEAIEKSEEFKPDLIISDINLGQGITGIEASKRIRKKYNIPVIYLTAYDDEDTLRVAKINDPFAYLIKPLQERELRIAINIALYKHKTEKKLTELVATKDKFFNIIAHDLINPFNAILGYNEILIDTFDTLTDNKKLEFLTKIYKTSKNTFNLLTNLLTWSRTQTGNMKHNPKPINLYNLIKDSIEQVKDQAKQKDIYISYTELELIKIYADFNMTSVIFRNLLSNAIKFTPDEGEITIEISKTGKMVTIEIKDNGIGIPEDKIDKLFKIEENFSRSGTNNEHGTGLGLILCKEFVEKNGGKIWVKSIEDQGSSFFFTIPIHKS